jgi:hypothetical protein
MENQEHPKPEEPPLDPFIPHPVPCTPEPPIQCAHEYDEHGKCRKCGFWHDLGQSIGEAIGEAKFGQ